LLKRKAEDPMVLAESAGFLLVVAYVRRDGLRGSTDGAAKA
jgi:hypothetical protein